MSSTGNTSVSNDQKLSNLTVGNYSFPTKSKTGQALSTNKSKILSFVPSQNKFIGYCQVTYPGAIVHDQPEDHLYVIDYINFIPNSVSVDTTTPYTITQMVPSMGRIKLQPGNYLVQCICPAGGSNQFLILLRNVTTGTVIHTPFMTQLVIDYFNINTPIPILLELKVDSNTMNLPSFERATIEITKIE
uniref:Uncharacterized protein n=1 Tax=viral metagenome TaxID=1070528 RepID=A0A6C0JVF5_9ZZZZ